MDSALHWYLSFNTKICMGGNFRKNGPKIFTLMDYVALSSLNMNKQDYLLAVADVYLETLVKE